MTWDMPASIDIQPWSAAVDTADSVETRVEAVEAIAQTGSVDAQPTLLAELNFNNPGAAVAAVDGFILIGEPAVDPLLDLLNNQNYGARAWALRALAGIGDPKALELLMETAKTDHALSVRRAAARGLGTIRWHLVDPAQMTTQQQRVLETLTQVAQDPEWVVRYAAIAGLQALAESLTATQPQGISPLLKTLDALAQDDEEPSVRARAQMAQRQLSKLAQSLLFVGDSDGHDAGDPPEWKQTLDRLYQRKSKERKPPSREGDPNNFRAVVSQLQVHAKKKALRLARRGQAWNRQIWNRQIWNQQDWNQQAWNRPALQPWSLRPIAGEHRV